MSGQNVEWQGSKIIGASYYRISPVIRQDKLCWSLEETDSRLLFDNERGLTFNTSMEAMTYCQTKEAKRIGENRLTPESKES